MSNNIEWAEASTLSIAAPKSITDPFGSTNERPALCFGDGVVVEGTRDELRVVAEKILAFTDKAET